MTSHFLVFPSASRRMETVFPEKPLQEDVDPADVILFSQMHMIFMLCERRSSSCQRVLGSSAAQHGCLLPSGRTSTSAFRRVHVDKIH